jgi:predicted nucleic acid-binding protein
MISINALFLSLKYERHDDSFATFQINRTIDPRKCCNVGSLPNDALILSLCKLNKIHVLASYDANDFQAACAKEGIIRLKTSADWDALKKQK